MSNNKLEREKSEEERRWLLGRITYYGRKAKKAHKRGQLEEERRMREISEQYAQDLIDTSTET